MVCEVCSACGQKIRGTKTGRIPESKELPLDAFGNPDMRFKVAPMAHRYMAIAYREGKTLQEIGDELDITRERVRQILSRYGITKWDSGKFKKGSADLISKARERAQKAEAKCMARYGCDLETFKRLSLGKRRSDNDSPMMRFTSQRNAAKGRGIAWEMTFAEWMTLWVESGKWEQRGIGIGKYCMARKMDTGPYAVGNVYITTCDDNVRDYQARLKVDGVEASDGYKRLPENPIFSEVTE